MLHWFLVFALGGAGAVLRVGIGTAIGMRAFPWATLLVNLVGCLAIGGLYEWLAERHALAHLWRPVLLGGLLGGFTTFSAFGLETWIMLQSGRAGAAVLYALASVGLGVLGVAVGVAIVRPAG
jgi:CrcB protein